MPWAEHLSNPRANVSFVKHKCDINVCFYVLKSLRGAAMYAAFLTRLNTDTFNVISYTCTLPAVRSQSWRLHGRLNEAEKYRYALLQPIYLENLILSTRN